VPSKGRSKLDAKTECSRKATRQYEKCGLAEVSAHAHEITKAELLQKPEEYLAVKGVNDPPNFYEWLQERAPHYMTNVGKIFLPGIIDNESIGNHIINMRWMTLDISSGNVTLLTGDRPFITTHGLAHPQCILAFPLSPTILFIATNTTELRNELAGLSATKIAKAVNKNIVERAVKHVYGLDDGHRRFVENRLRR